MKVWIEKPESELIPGEELIIYNSKCYLVPIEVDHLLSNEELEKKISDAFDAGYLRGVMEAMAKHNITTMQMVIHPLFAGILFPFYLEVVGSTCIRYDT